MKLNFKKILTAIMMVTLTHSMIFSVARAEDKYFYRSRVNWVKLDKLSTKDLGGTELKHPLSLTSDKMVGMLTSINMSKGSALSKEIKETAVFSEEEARLYAPKIVEALSQAATNEVVNVSIVHRRPNFILRNDYLSIVNIFVTDKGIHFNFSKLFAKLDGDYRQASNMDKAVNKAKSLKVSLEARQGQTLLAEYDEIIIQSDFEYSVPVAIESGVAGEGASAKSNLTPATSQSSGSVKQKLLDLEDLKKSGLITDAEYKAKRAKILANF